MVIHTWKCLVSRLMLCDSHIMESPWASSPKTYKPMSSFVRPCSTPALFTWLKFQSSRQGFGSKAGICSWNNAICLSWETLKLGWGRASSLPLKSWKRGTIDVERHIHRFTVCPRTVHTRTRTHTHTHTHTRDCIWRHNLMKHISYAFARSALEIERKYFWNVFNQWLLESGGYTLLISERVCPGKRVNYPWKVFILMSDNSYYSSLVVTGCQVWGKYKPNQNIRSQPAEWSFFSESTQMIVTY